MPSLSPFLFFSPSLFQIHSSLVPIPCLIGGSISCMSSAGLDLGSPVLVGYPGPGVICHDGWLDAICWDTLFLLSCIADLPIDQLILLLMGAQDSARNFHSISIAL